MIQTPAADPRQAQMNQMMQWMFPMMFTFISLTFPAGLPLYWLANSLVRIALQYKLAGWGGIRRTPRGDEGGRDKKYVNLVSSAERKSSDDIGADIVVSDSQQPPSKTRYLPSKDRQRHKKKR